MGHALLACLLAYLAIESHPKVPLLLIFEFIGKCLPNQTQDYFCTKTRTTTATRLDD